MNLYESLKKLYCKTLFFLLIDTTLVSDNPLCFRKNLLEKCKNLWWQMMIRLEMKNYNIIEETAKTSLLSLDKIDKYEYLVREEILPTDQSKMIKQTKLTYSPLDKAFEKQLN